jgi:hypothetical protein
VVCLLILAIGPLDAHPETAVLMRTAFFLLLLVVGLVTLTSGCNNVLSEEPMPHDILQPAEEGFVVVTARPSHPLRQTRMQRVDVCHYVRDLDTYIRIQVAEPALVAHIRQGGGVPGGEVPGREGYTFNQECQPVSISPSATFSCSAVPGLDSFGRKTLTVTNRVDSPTLLPIERADIALSNVAILRMEDLYDDGVRTGYLFSGAQRNSSLSATLSVQLVGENMPEAGIVCGPYEFGGPASL